jgi:foldase protein PrsA
VNRIRVSLLIVAMLFLAACGGGTATESSTGTKVARVGDVIITQEQLDSRVEIIKNTLNELGQADSLPEDQVIKEQLANSMVEQYLILEIATRQGISVQDSEVEDQITQLRQSIAGGDPTQFKQAINGQLGMPGEDSSEFRQFVVSLLAQSKLAITLVNTDTVRSEIAQIINAQASELVDMVEIAHIQLADEATANEVIEKLQQGQSFEDLALEYSQDTRTSGIGGVLGTIQRGEIFPEIEEIVFALDDDSYSETPVETQIGFHVLKTIAHTQQPAIAPEEVETAIEMQLQQELMQRRGQAMEELYATTRETALSEGWLEEPNFGETTPTP